jgi:RNA polymerase sigma factor (sigma-70 family)
MEASAIHAPASIGRLPLGLPLLRLRSDDQLLAHFRAGSDEAFRVLHDRYRQRLFAYVRQMLSGASRQDAEDVLQDVFVRAYGALRNDSRDMNVRAWLYRVAHNRCIDHLRRPVPPPAEIFEVSRKPLHDPIEEAQRRDDLRRLVEDVARLPDQQRSALLMREIDGMSYANLAVALDVTVPAVKSLLVRARIGLVEAAEARDADCAEIREDLLRAYDKGVKASGRARKHMRSCDGCREYRVALRGVRRSFAALSPVGFGPVALVAKLAGIGGGGAAASGGAAAAGGSAAITTGGIATATACKVAAVVCTAALAGGAVEVNREISARRPAAPAHVSHVAKKAPKVAAAAAAAAAPVALHRAAVPVVLDHSSAAATGVRAHAPAHVKHKAKKVAPGKPAAPALVDDTTTVGDYPRAQDDPSLATGGARAPDAPSSSATPAPTTAPETGPTEPIAGQPQPAPDPASAQSGTPADTAPETGAAPAPSPTPAAVG